MPLLLLRLNDVNVHATAAAAAAAAAERGCASPAAAGLLLQLPAVLETAANRLVAFGVPTEWPRGVSARLAACWGSSRGFCCSGDHHHSSSSSSSCDSSSGPATAAAAAARECDVALLGLGGGGYDQNRAAAAAAAAPASVGATEGAVAAAAAAAEQGLPELLQVSLCLVRRQEILTEEDAGDPFEELAATRCSSGQVRPRAFAAAVRPQQQQVQQHQPSACAARASKQQQQQQQQQALPGLQQQLEGESPRAAFCGAVEGCCC
ncbi:hypothetical protein, conserved [Eimeria tenella]|uniref:Uncharacterized protein n=1 Tax=Eimeria tenella TaxID=5802 RepID=U6KPF9_EIMTE|nr:hypothetical protein, conserved [Eimeria tenella]CDJ38798.1 hypothetical protein, conserved [Eimeria tenella]|eukprot:XP_013229554.1 hypothetical protein, conserved [Eimeria tenella]